MDPGFTGQKEPPAVAATEHLIMIKTEPPETEFVGIPMDLNVDAHTLIKTEMVPEQVFVEAEKVNLDDLRLIKTEHADDDNGQELLEAQALGHLKTDEQHILNFSFQPQPLEKADTLTWEQINGKFMVLEAPTIPIDPHEYTSLAQDQHMCNHCQHVCKKLNAVKYHIRKVHKEVTTMYQCLYCSFKSKWKTSLRLHITYKHKDAQDGRQWIEYCCDKCDYKTFRQPNMKKHQIVHLRANEIQYFYCEHCPYKSRHKTGVRSHTLRHFKSAEIKQNRKRFECDKCDYTTFERSGLKVHKLNHLKPHEIEYFYCYHCPYKSKRKETLKGHIFRHFKKTVEIKPEKRKRYPCEQCDFKAYKYAHIKKHELTHLKPEEIPYFYCYHCSYKAKQKGHLKIHVFRHFKNGDVPFHCYVCDFMTLKRELIVKHIKKHSKGLNKAKVNKGS